MSILGFILPARTAIVSDPTTALLLTPFLGVHKSTLANEAVRHAFSAAAQALPEAVRLRAKVALETELETKGRRQDVIPADIVGQLLTTTHQVTLRIAQGCIAELGETGALARGISQETAVEANKLRTIFAAFERGDWILEHDSPRNLIRPGAAILKRDNVNGAKKLRKVPRGDPKAIFG